MNLKTVHRGFTLIELLVVLAIIGVLMAVTVTGQNSFGASTILSSTAYDMALSIRQAQVYGVAGKGDVSYGYGVDFNRATGGSYVLFKDAYPTSASTCASVNPNEPIDAPSTKHGDCLYDNAGTETVQKISINNGIVVTNFCVYKNSGAYCSNTGTDRINQMDISFIRPKTDAIIYAEKSGSSDLVTDAGSACIKISKFGGVRYIVIDKVGTIAVLQEPGTSCQNI